MANGKIIFYGTSAICIPFLNNLIKNFKIELIITQPDKKGGRKNKIIIPPVKLFAIENKIDYIQPEKLNKNVEEIISKLSPDIAIVIAYGQLIPKNIYQIPEFDTINVHFSLLPKYRGAAPVQRAIENGETKTGISIFSISKKMDAGQIWYKENFIIEPDDTTQILWDKLSNFTTPILTSTISNIFNGIIIKEKQNHLDATYAPPIEKSEGEINWNMSANTIYNKLRAFFPWPGIFFRMNNKKFKITEAEVVSIEHSLDIGKIVQLDKSGLYISCVNRSVLRIKTFQPEGKKPMTPHSYSIGNKISSNLD